jgi:hypothetical protein
MMRLRPSVKFNLTQQFFSQSLTLPIEVFYKCERCKSSECATTFERER